MLLGFDSFSLTQNLSQKSHFSFTSRHKAAGWTKVDVSKEILILHQDGNGPEIWQYGLEKN
jgi:hypothetical protein